MYNTNAGQGESHFKIKTGRDGMQASIHFSIQVAVECAHAGHRYIYNKEQSSLLVRALSIQKQTSVEIDRNSK